MSNTPPKKSQTPAFKTDGHKNLRVWFDDLSGIQLTHTNAAEVAKWIGPNATVGSFKTGNVVTNTVLIKTNRGDLTMAIGDFATRDLTHGNLKIVRISAPRNTINNKVSKEQLKAV